MRQVAMKAVDPHLHILHLRPTVAAVLYAAVTTRVLHTPAGNLRRLPPQGIKRSPPHKTKSSSNATSDLLMIRSLTGRLR